MIIKDVWMIKNIWLLRIGFFIKSWEVDNCIIFSLLCKSHQLRISFSFLIKICFFKYVASLTTLRRDNRIVIRFILSNLLLIRIRIIVAEIWLLMCSFCLLYLNLFPSSQFLLSFHFVFDCFADEGVCWRSLNVFAV